MNLNIWIPLKILQLENVFKRKARRLTSGEEKVSDIFLWNQSTSTVSMLAVFEADISKEVFIEKL